MVSLSATWTKVTPSIPLHRSSLAVSILGSKAYVLGGEVIPRTPLDSDLFSISIKDGKVETFKPSASSSSSWPSARVGSASTTVGTNVYIWGGRGGKAMTPSSGELFKFDTLASTFSLVPVAASLEGETPEDRSFHVLTSYKDTLFLHAGCPVKGRLPTLHSLDLSSAEPAWKQLPSAPGAGRGGTNLALLPLPSPVFARFGGFAGVELDDFALFNPTTSLWFDEATVSLFSPTSPRPPARSVAGFVGLPSPQLLPSSSASIVALLFLGEKECTAPSVGHDGAGVFHDGRLVWALTVKGDGSEAGSWEWKEAGVKNGGKPEGLGWFGSGWWEEGGGAVLVGGLQGENERRGDLWVLRVAEE